jgi:putative transposase
MPRKARIDAPGALHHIICRGIEGRSIFIGDMDRDDFVERLAQIVSETETSCFAWALIPNHFHLLLRTGNVPIATVMRRLLTGYAVNFNHRHQRHGRLFQNRYKSILCQQERYLLELVRYIHLNPLRAGMVDSMKSLDAYAYSGHSRLIGTLEDEWQAVADVLAFFDSHNRKKALARYQRFLKDGISQGKRSDLTGGGLVRSTGGWIELKSKRGMKEDLKGDERILGDSDFVKQVLESAQEALDHRYRLAAAGFTLERVIELVADHFDMDAKSVYTPGKQPRRVKARSVVAYLAVRQLGMVGTAIGKQLNMSQSAVSRAVDRGERLAADDEISLPI